MKLIIKVIPRSITDAVMGEEQDQFGNRILKIKTIKPAENNQANEAIIHILASHFDVPKRHITILSGHASRVKMVNIEGVASTS